MQNKKTLVFLFIVIGLFFTVSMVSADNRAVWIEGHVTRTPWPAGAYHMIEVDTKIYKIQSDIRMTRRFQRNKGAYDERTADIYSITTNQKIVMKVKRKEIIQIILY